MTSASLPQDSGEPTGGSAQYLTAAEAAEVLRVGPWQVAQLCQTKRLRASKPGKAWLIDRADLDAYISAHANLPAESA